MHWLAFVTAIGLSFFCYAQQYDIDVSTLSIDSATNRSCDSCSINIRNFEFAWYSEAYTHVAATVVKFINNATNVTTTSTIQGSEFTIPESAGGNARTVSDSVITTEIGGTLYTLTYPKQYRGVGRIEKNTKSVVTKSNGTVKCVVARTVFTNHFLLHEDISNGLELTALSIYNYGTQSCNIDEVSPPGVLVRVSSLTATTTSYFNTLDARTSAAKKASPSIPLSPPTVPRTSSSPLRNRPTVLATPSARETGKSPSIITESISAEPAPLNPADSASTAATFSASETPIETKTSDVEVVSRSSVPAPVSSQEPNNEHSASEPTAPASTALDSQAFISTPSPKSLLFSSLNFIPSNPELSQELKASAPLIGNGITDSGTFVTHGAIITISGTPVSLGSSNIVIGTQTVSLPANQPTSVFSAAGQTFTANPTGFLIGSTRLLPNGPAVTISDTPVFLGASGIVIGTKTIALPSDTSLPVLTVGRITFTANPTGFPIGSTRLLPNGPAVTISQTPVSLGASGIVIGTKTIALPSDSSLPVFTVGGITFTANPTGFYVGTFSPHGALVTTSRTPISPSLPSIVIDTGTIGLPAAPSILTVDGEKFTASSSGFNVGGTEIHRGGSPITISGTPILLESSDLVIGSSTVPLASVTHGLGPAILSALGYTAIPTPTDEATAGNYSAPLEPYAGGQIRIKAPIILLVSCVGLVGVIWA